MDDKIYRGPGHPVGAHFHSGPPGKQGLPGVSPKVDMTYNEDDGAVVFTVTDGYGQRDIPVPMVELVSDWMERDSYEVLQQWMDTHTDAEWWVDENNGLHLSNVPPDADDRILDAVEDWFTDHPEATTTVQDDSLTTQKFVPSLRQKIDSKARYIFPRNFGYSVGDGDCNLITVDGVTILIDCHDDAASAWTQVQQFLSDNNITHIDYFIISHYHADHVDNVPNLINIGLIDSNTIVYAAPVGEFMHRMTGDMTDRATATITALENAGITPVYPSEWDSFYPVPTMKISFYNCDTDVFNSSSWSNIYNECSMLCLVEHGRNAALYTGDAYQKAIRRALDNGFLNRTVDLYKINHHGIQTNNATYRNLSRINPTYAVQPSHMGMDRRNTHNQNVERQVLQMLGCKIFQCHSNSEDIVFESDVNSLAPVRGLASMYGGNYSQEQTIYVDISYTGDVQDGTQEHPFHELSQALAGCLPFSPIQYNVILADGRYNESHETVERNAIKAHGVWLSISSASEDASKVVIASGFEVRSCVLTASNVTFDCSTAPNEMYDTNASFSSVVFDGNQGNAQRQLSIYKSSECRLTNCVFSNFLNSIRVSTGGRLYYDGCTFINGSGIAITAADGGAIKENYPMSNTFTDVVTKYSISDYANLSGSGQYIYSGSDSTQSYTGRKRRAGLITLADGSKINMYFFYVKATGVPTVVPIEEQISDDAVTVTVSSSTITFSRASSTMMMFVREF